MADCGDCVVHPSNITAYQYELSSNSAEFRHDEKVLEVRKLSDHRNCKGSKYLQVRDTDSSEMKVTDNFF